MKQDEAALQHVHEEKTMREIPEADTNVLKETDRDNEGKEIKVGPCRLYHLLFPCQHRLACCVTSKPLSAGYAR
jgi:hypothetical protein